MFAVNGPSGPTSRHERRVRVDRPQTEEERRAQRKKRNAFFQTREATANKTTTAPDEGNAISQIFKGCRIYFNGRTGKISSYYLAKLVQEHGGNMSSEYKVTRVTHMVACNLSGSKADKVFKSCGKVKCVRPEWILESVKQGKRLPEFDFLVYKDKSSSALAVFTTPTAPK